MKQPERRYLNRPADPVKLHERAGALPLIQGYAAVFYNAGDPGTRFMLWEDFEERILPGAFDKALTRDNVLGCFNHDVNKILGRSTAGTLRLSVDARGLRYEIDPPDTATGREVVELLRRGDVSGSSFMFEVTDGASRKENGVYIREISGVKLYDVGPVTFPAYTGTEAGIRAAGDLTALRREVDRLRGEPDRDLIAVTLAGFEMED